MTAEIEIPPDAFVVFDMDDTLYLERDYVRSGFTAVGAHVEQAFGVVGFGSTLWEGFELGVRGDAFDRALLAHDLVDDGPAVAELVAVYRSHEPVIDLLPDARDLLDRLGSRPLGLITDGPSASQWAKIRPLGLEARLSFIVVTGDHGLEWTKPSELPYIRCEQLAAAEPAQCWYIGDNPHKDFVTPSRRGWTSVRVRRAASLHHEAATPTGVVEIESLDQLLALQSTHSGDS